ncbi:hypothetical protein D3C80_858400 [compost metagenome]
MILKNPAAKPGIATNQKSWSLENENPNPGNFTAITLIINQEEKDNINDKVVIVNVFQAILLPVFSQNSSFSGSQLSSQVFIL